MINYCFILVSKKIRDVKGEFGVSILINTAIALMITAFILLPSIKTLATDMTVKLAAWYDTSIETVLFSETK
jgi:hypothetical protein